MPSPPPGGIRDFGDAEIVSFVLTDVALCVDCIVKKTGLPAPRVHTTLATIGRPVKVDRAWSLCTGCLITKRVFQLVCAS